MPGKDVPESKWRTDLVCPDCGGNLIRRESKTSPFYGCSNFPTCKTTHPAHPDGRPKGTPGDAATRRAREMAHRIFDRIWKEKLVKNRGAAYAWMRKTLKLSKAEAHIGDFSAEQCDRLMKAVYAAFPKVRGDRWTALLVDPLED